MVAFLSVVVCAHNPRQDYFHAAVEALKAQSLDRRRWELLIIDNASEVPLAGQIDLAWHPGARIVREDRLGLSYARLRSYRESNGEIILYVDDDNILASDYLGNVLSAFERMPQLGAVGGKVLPRYELPPPAWFNTLGISLACRDLGDEPITATWSDVRTSRRSYPECAPIGAGMAVRRSAYAAYVAAAECDPKRTALGRQGANLASGEDNDIVMSVLDQGFAVAYLPELRLEHLISAKRLSPAYLARYARSTNLTWVQVLDLHGIRPWSRVAPWTRPLRHFRAYVRNMAWMSHANYIRWQAACGQIDGRASLGVG